MIAQSRLAGLSSRTKLVLAMAFCAAILVGLTLFAVQHYNETLPQVSGILLAELSEERLSELSSTIHEYASIVSQIAIDPLNQTNFTALNASATENVDADARRALQIAFRQVLNMEPTIRQIRFVSVEGKTLISLPSETSDRDETDEDYFVFFKGKLPTRPGDDVYISTIKTVTSPTLDFVAVPVNANQATGFVVVSVDVTGSADTNVGSVYRALRPAESNAGTVSFYILDNKPQLIEPSGKPVNLVSNTVANMRAVLDAVSNANSKTFDFTSPLIGTSVKGIVSRIPDTGLYLVTEISQQQFVEGVEGLRFGLLLLGALIIGVILIAFIGITLDSALVRPTEQLLNAAQHADAEVAVTDVAVVEGTNEISRLQNMLNTLKARAQQNAQSLEAQVVQRTHDLEAARDIVSIMTEARNVDELFELSAKSIEQHFQSIKSVQVYLIDEKNQMAILSSSSSKDSGISSSVHRVQLVDANMIGKTYLTAQPHVARSTFERASDELLPGMRSELAIPLKSEDKIIGILDLQSNESAAFSESDITLFTSVTQQLTTSWRNLQFVEELQKRVQENELLTRQLMGETWRRYVDTDANKAINTEWSDLQRSAAESGQLMEKITADVVTFAVPVTLRGEVIGAVEWDMSRSAYNENTRLLARELAARLAISADNARLFEQTQRIAQRERLVNSIASKLSQQNDVTEILKVAIREVGQALRVPQTAIRLATSPDSEQV